MAALYININSRYECIYGIILISEHQRVHKRVQFYGGVFKLRLHIYFIAQLMRLCVCVCVCVYVYMCLRLTWILLSMLGLKMYMPALILLETKT